ncbi:MAG: sterol desaturase family protein [Oculatellaceae cyanobacterium bins.114]|nr:sterol desaturase family protein [Oculatellaceae cyanobacterium bins.114]
MVATTFVTLRHRLIKQGICLLFILIFVILGIALQGSISPSNIAFISSLFLFSTLEIFSCGITKKQRLVSDFVDKPYAWEKRVWTNLVLVLLGGIVSVYLVLLANRAELNSWALFNIFNVPFAAVMLLSFLFLDLSHYTVHVLHHNVPALWRFHVVHHNDKVYDVTNAGREHPFITATIKLAEVIVIILFGVPPLAYAIYAPAQIASSLFFHSNLKIPDAVDRKLRWLLVTPSLHYTHHSSIARDTDSVYGSILSIWDRFFGTYKNAPDMGIKRMEVGVDTFSNQNMGVLQLLVLPFLNWSKLRRPHQG